MTRASAVLRIIAVLSLSISTDALSSFTLKKKQSPPIKRVAIIGTGIAGLSLANALENSKSCAQTYLQELQKQPSENTGESSVSNDGNNDGDVSPFGIETHLFDSRDSLNFSAGAGIQLTGGMSTLKKINPDVQRALVKASLPLTGIKSRAKPWFTFGESDSKSFWPLLEMNLGDVFRNDEVAKDELIVDGEVMAYSVMRGALQEVLLNELPQRTKNRVQFGKTLSGIKSAPTGNDDGIICVFQDGSEAGPFDLVVGCDGVNSPCKEYVEKGKVSSTTTTTTNTDGSSPRSAIYSGIRIQYAVKDGEEDDPDVDSAELCQYFGDGAYSLAGIYGAGEGRKPTKGAFLIFQDPDYIGPFKKKKNEESISLPNEEEVAENVDWTQDVESVGTTMYSRIQQSNVPTVQVGPIIENSDRFFELGVYFHNPLSFNGWSREVSDSGGRHVVLSGDAAHCMPPFLGQGSNQAIQDAYTLSRKIFQHNANCIKESTNSIMVGSSSTIDQEVAISQDNDEIKPLSVLLKEYENKRWFPTASITAKAAFLGYLETGSKGFLSSFRDAFFFFAGKVGLAKKVFLDAATPKIE